MSVPAVSVQPGQRWTSTSLPDRVYRVIFVRGDRVECKVRGRRHTVPISAFGCVLRLATDA